MTPILHLINTGGPGGGETVYLELVRRLDRDRWGAVPVVPDRGWIWRRVREEGFEPVVARSRVPFDVLYLARLGALIRRHGVRLIHSHYFGPSVTASVLGRLFRIPVVATVHGTGDLSEQERYRTLKFSLINGGATRVVFVSDPLRQAFLEHGLLRPELTAVIPNGVDTARFRPGRDGAFRREMGIADDEILVGAVGNLRPSKGYHVLLRAAALLREPGRPVRFVIIGENNGPLQAELLALRDRLGLGDAVRFTGFREDVAAAMRDFDLYALSSTTEGFSLTTIQAMASGLPVVATRCGGPEEILEDGRTGRLVAAGSPEALADGITALLDRPEEGRRLAQAALREARNRFGLDVQVRRYEALYEAVTGAGSPQPAPAPMGGRA